MVYWLLILPMLNVISSCDKVSHSKSNFLRSTICGGDIYFWPIYDSFIIHLQTLRHLCVSILYCSFFQTQFLDYPNQSLWTIKFSSILFFIFYFSSFFSTQTICFWKALLNGDFNNWFKVLKRMFLLIKVCLHQLFYYVLLFA